MSEGKTVAMILALLPSKLAKLGRKEIQQGSLKPPIQITCYGELGNVLHEMKMNLDAKGVPVVVEEEPATGFALKAVPQVLSVTISSEIDGKKIHKEIRTAELEPQNG